MKLIDDMKVKKKANRSIGGFSLIEVNLAILMIAVGLLALFSLFPLGLRESERGMADTQESMFADTVLSALEGNAMNITTWGTWTNNLFNNAVKDGMDYIPHIYDDDVINSIEFPDASGMKLRYRLKIENVGGDAGRKRATLNVKQGRYGDFDLATTYYTEFVYMGM